MVPLFFAVMFDNGAAAILDFFEQEKSVEMTKVLLLTESGSVFSEFSHKKLQHASSSITKCDWQIFYA